ncbi:MAG: glycosyltransferase family A protein [Pacificimonas sp.]|jgi:glycosyltransferase involved in cell wall biosynthesis|nr:glycosyltransferase family A protein [Pacificimonas sp.]
MSKAEEQSGTGAPLPRWSAVIPVYNERDYLPRTLASLADQQQPVRIIVVDNGSTDGCIEDAKALAAARDLDVQFLSQAQPGQVHALKTGIDAAETEFVAICDADTWYPPHYLTRAGDLFEEGGPDRVALGALLMPERSAPLRDWWAANRRLAASKVWPRQNHTSGAAQLYRTSTLKAAGGYDARRWPYVLKDHELMDRVLRLGSQTYDRALWCISSERREDRTKVRWTLSERLLYHVTPFAAKHWFFNSFLKARFAARGQKDTVLRDQSWAQGGEADGSRPDRGAADGGEEGAR